MTITFVNPVAPDAAHVSVVDLAPHSPDQIDKVVNVNDVFAVTSAFGGDPYPGSDIVLCPRTIDPPIRAPAPHDILKNRYISIDPRGALVGNPFSHHIRVFLDSTLVPGQTYTGPWWARRPDANGVSIVALSKPAKEPDWSSFPVVHLTGCPIIPTTTYAIAIESVGQLSADVLLDTQDKPGVKFWADCVGFFNGTEWTPPNGVVNSNDFIAVGETASNPTGPTATHFSVTDLAPHSPNGINKLVDSDDIDAAIIGFTGLEYPGLDIALCIEPPILAPPPHDILKNRYISIDPTAGGLNPSTLHVKLTFTGTLVDPPHPPPHPDIGSVWWASPPDALGLSVVTSVKPLAEPDWTGFPTVHLTGCPIIPTSTYDITVIDSAGTESAAHVAHTQAKPGTKWYGDVVGKFDAPTSTWTPPNGTVNADDYLSAIKTFLDKSAFNATHTSVTDVAPNDPGSQINRIVNINDVLIIIFGFKGQEYPGGAISLCP